MSVLNLGHYRIVEKFGDERRCVVDRAHNEQLDRYSNERARFLMRILNLGLALVLSVSMLWAQSGAATWAEAEAAAERRQRFVERSRREYERQPSSCLPTTVVSLRFAVRTPRPKEGALVLSRRS